MQELSLEKQKRQTAFGGSPIASQHTAAATKGKSLAKK